ncbi:oxidation resistance protein 1 isoform X1 [Pygocentrus nattereri]|uniref:oxidation resistance protein 1 isoform X1 n=1 Tax=Pygocentrus nattereri TaxID=42514 RepID=UPI00081495C2|nr:oxidation resistance protein 1 isoform X1 [Pygocentrus nattereri]
MDYRQHRDKTRASYFGNVKNRLGTKMPAGVTQPPGFFTGSWDTTSRANGARNILTAAEGSAGRHHIRNPKLRQYYLKEAAFPSDANKTLESSGESSRRNEQGVHQGDTVFSVASQFSGRPADTTQSTATCSALSTTQKPRVPQSKASPAQGQPPTATNPDLCPSSEPRMDAVTPTTPVSPSTDAEYDKLLDVEAVPMPDGQLCLLALPPECAQGAGPTDMPYLKLFCRFITDRKGVVSGILLVTANKIFFDPHKSLPLVQENGCEEYLFSCSVDNLATVSFFSDISHVHFSKSTQRWKGRKKSSKSKPSKDRIKESQSEIHSATPQSKADAVPALVRSATWDLHISLRTGAEASTGEEEGGESRDMAEVERQLEQLTLESSGTLGAAVLSSAATFCCGGANTELEQDCRTEQQPCLKKQVSGQGCASSLMFVRMRQKPQAAKKKGFAALELGKAKPTACRDAWFTMQQDSSDELYAYLTQHRPDLCILEGGEDEEAERDEDDFVLIDEGEREEEEEEESTRDGRAGDEWEIVCVEDSRGKGLLSLDKEPEGLSDILKQSLILNAQHIQELSSELPPRTVGHSWKLAYSTSKHGASLKTLYRKLSVSDSPVLLLIRDDNQQVFGSFLSNSLRPSDTFYGTGETFLFLLHPRFKSFRWTGENSFFIKGDLDSFAIGGGSGHFGLWLDETLYLGRSSPCYTFNNCSLSETSDFRVLELEAWTFW